MEALQFNPQTKVLSYQTLPKPTISQEDDIIVEVAFAGLCGTDLHIIQGEFPSSSSPFILGHEFSGIVREVGNAVKHVKPGDKVVLDPQNWCQTCEFCTTARYHLCVSGGVDCATGIAINGGWAKYALCRARQIYKLPDSLSLKQGALCEPVSCIMWGLERATSKLFVGEEVLITGAGIIGNLWSAILHYLGHRKVTVVEPSDERRKINKLLDTGFECVTPQELNEIVASGKQFNLAIDCSGNGSAIEQAYKALNFGGTLCIFGVASPDTEIRVSPYEIFKKEITIVGTIINPFSMKKAIGLMDAMGERYLDYEKLGVQEYQMKDYDEAISNLRKGSISKVMFCINDNLE